MSNEKKFHKAFPDGVDASIQDSWLDRLENLNGFVPTNVCYGHDSYQSPRAHIRLTATMAEDESEFEVAALQGHIYQALWALLPETRIELIYNSEINGVHEWRGGWQPLDSDLVESDVRGCEFYLVLEHIYPTPGNKYVDDWFEDVIEALEGVLGVESRVLPPKSSKPEPKSPEPSTPSKVKSKTPGGETIH